MPPQFRLFYHNPSMTPPPTDDPATAHSPAPATLHRMILSAVALIALIALAGWSLTRHSPQPPPTTADTPHPTHPRAHGTIPTSFPEKTVLRPLPVSQSGPHNEWTSDDATQPEVLGKIAHNPDEFIRMYEENNRIKRRQLVYRKQSVPQLVREARDHNTPFTSFVLPGLNGQEYEVAVNEVRLLPNGRDGSANGHLKNHLHSIVSVGFANGCESYNIISPDDGIYLAADAREPGEVIVKEIDPEKFGVHPESSTPDFIPTHPPKASPHPPASGPSPVP